MTKKIFRSILMVAIAVFTASVVLIMNVLYGYFSDMQLSQIKNQADLAAQGVEYGGVSYIEGLDISDYRITLINPDGTVRYDSQSNPAEMENHLSREEVKEAAETGSGESVRYSTTLMKRQIYSAVRLSDGSIIRVSQTQHSWFSLIVSTMQPVAIIALLAIILSLILASSLSKNIVRPLNELNPDKPAENNTYEELSPLMERLRSQQRQLKRQKKELRRKKDEFDAATAYLNEGLVLLNEESEIISINRYASHLFGFGRGGENDIFKTECSEEIRSLLDKSRNGENAETIISIGGCNYQINASPVISNEKICGIAMLIFDITEKEKAEQIRREFTANVSHELKTPLHTISGCAELLSGGLVKPEDVSSFSQRIFEESKRMISLVEDIIKLSRLDEGIDSAAREETELYGLAEAAVRSLREAAEKAEVTISVSGEKSSFYGIPHLVGGIIYNLCDNAIKYNKKGGNVNVKIRDEKDASVLIVTDTGIGIPEQQQERIFERFYRVDKSHSKEVGGTGLGLSIVKHAAKIHNACIELSSVVNKGTTIKVTFPKS